MKKLYTFLILTLLSVGVFAQTGKKMTFQGTLYKASEPFSGTANLQFTIKLDSNRTWTETFTSVSVVNGLYSVALGTFSPLPEDLFFGVNERTINVVVDGSNLGDVKLHAPFSAKKGLQSLDELKYTIMPIDTGQVRPVYSFLLEGSNGDSINIRSALLGRSSTTGFNRGVEGTAVSTIGNTNFQYGLYGRAFGEGTGLHYAIRGEASAPAGWNVGVRGMSIWANTADNYGAWFSGRNSTAQNIGVRADASGAGANRAIWGSANGGSENWAGWFDGDVRITGQLITDVPVGLSRRNEIGNTGLEGDTAYHYQVTADDVVRGIQVDMQGLGTKFAVRGNSNSQAGDEGLKIGVLGSSVGQGTGNHEGIRGQAFGVGRNNTGVIGLAGGSGNGVTGYEEGSYNNGLTGYAYGNSWGNAGVFGNATGGIGVDNLGVVGLSDVGDSTNTTIENKGVLGRAEGPGVNKGVMGMASGGVENWAGWFDGNMKVTGDLDIDGKIIGSFYSDNSSSNSYSLWHTDGTKVGTLLAFEKGSQFNGFGINRNLNPSDTAYAGGGASIGAKFWEDGNNGQRGYVHIRGTVNPANIYDANLKFSMEAIASENGREEARFLMHGTKLDGNNLAGPVAMMLSKTDTAGVSSGELTFWKGGETAIKLDGSNGSANISGNLSVGSLMVNDQPIEFSNFLTTAPDRIENNLDENAKPSLVVNQTGSNGSNYAAMHVFSNADTSATALYAVANGTGHNVGIQGRTDGDGSSGRGVYGFVRMNQGSAKGVEGIVDVSNNPNSNFDMGVSGQVYGNLTSNFSVGVYGQNTVKGGSESWGTGGFAGGDGMNKAFRGRSNSVDTNTYEQFGAWLQANGTGTGDHYGSWSRAAGLGKNIGVYGIAEGGTENWGGWFDGNVNVTGTAIAKELKAGDYFGGTGIYLNGNDGSMSTSSDINSDANINASGNVTGVNGTFSGVLSSADGTVQTSDRRFKKDIHTLEKALPEVLKMRGVTYYWKDQNKTQNRQIGLIAQEVEEIFPEFVHTDSNGNKAVNYAQMTAVLIEAVKELNAQVEQLKMENKDLEAKVADMKKLDARLMQIEKLLKGEQASDITTTSK